MFGGNVPALGTDGTGQWTTALLTNEEVLAVNQDRLGARAKRLRRDGTIEVWARPLSGGRKAVALFNRGPQDATIAVSFAELGLSGAQVVRDVWRRKDVPAASEALSSTVPHDSALMFTLSPPAQPDTRPPEPPGTPTAADLGPTSLTVSWPASTDDVGVTAYTVRDRTAPGDATVATVTLTSAALSGLSPATRYAFDVRARDAAGNVSAPSPAVTVTTLPRSDGGSTGGGGSSGSSGGSGATEGGPPGVRASGCASGGAGWLALATVLAAFARLRSGPRRSAPHHRRTPPV